MKKLFTLLAVLAIALFPVNSYAWDPPASPKPASAISDPSGVLSDAAHRRLDSQLKQINASSANEIAVLILPTLDGEDISDVGIATAKSWGVGKKDLDNGVLVILAMKEHKSRIETGKGVEGDLPDLKCRDILDNDLRPHMKKGDVEGGLSATISSISSSIANHKSEVANGTKHSASCQVSQPGADDSNPMLWFIVGFVIGFTVIVSWKIIARRKREQEEREANARLEQELAEMRKESAAKAQALKAQKEALVRQREALDALTPVVPVAVMPRPSTPKPPVMKTSHIKPTVVATASTVTLASLEAERHRKEENERRERAEADRRRQQQEEDDRRRRQEDDDRRRRDAESSSSSSSGSSFDWGGGSSGGDFGGGDFGGGGSSSSW